MQPPDLVQEIQMAMKGGQDHLLGQLPWMIYEAIDKQIWTTYSSGMKGKPWGTFEAWVSHPPWEGLNSTVEELLFFCRKEPEVQQRIREAVGELAGRGRPKQDHGKDRNTNIKTQDDATYALKRLKRDRPDLAAKVVKGELSANAAAIEAGFRRKSVQITDADPATAAKRIREKFGEEFAGKLGDLLRR